MTTYNEYRGNEDNEFNIKKAMYELVGSADISIDADTFKNALKLALEHYGV